MASKKKTLRILCWNVNGVRAIANKGFHDWLKKESPDILCLQETKAQIEQLDETLTKIENYCCHYFSAEKKGYSGVATYSRIEPKSVKKGFGKELFDLEGRVIESEFEDFTLFNVYFPNSGRGLHRLRYKLDFYDELFFYTEKLRRKKKNIIICGDFNTAHHEIDLAEPKKHKESPGFMEIEREWMDKIINLGYADVFRELHKNAKEYTFWDNYTMARNKNLGWRIDLFCVTKEMMPLVKKTKIHNEVMGSDHCPIELELELK